MQKLIKLNWSLELITRRRTVHRWNNQLPWPQPPPPSQYQIKGNKSVRRREWLNSVTPWGITKLCPRPEKQYHVQFLCLIDFHFQHVGYELYYFTREGLNSKVNCGVFWVVLSYFFRNYFLWHLHKSTLHVRAFICTYGFLGTLQYLPT